MDLLTFFAMPVVETGALLFLLEILFHMQPIMMDVSDSTGKNTITKSFQINVTSQFNNLEAK